MEVTIVSREAIKPVPNSTSHLKPHKLCLFDQLTPTTYIVGVIFYPIFDPNINYTETFAHMKKCLSQILSIYYPLSGRNDCSNLYVGNFDAGVPFIETRVNCRMSEYLNRKDVDELNKLVPFAPFRRETADPLEVPLFSMQANVFSCGGVALGTSVCHKNSDGTTACFLINSWAALCNGNPERVINPSFSDATEVFPPVESGLPERYSTLMERVWFTEGSYASSRFVFSAESIKTLQAEARSERVPNPTRNDVVSSLIWKHATEASQTVTGRARTSVAGPAVNVRPGMTSPTAANSVGNLFWWGVAIANPNEDGTGLELSELVAQMRDALEGFEGDILKEVKEGRDGSPEIMNRMELMLAVETEDPFIIGFTNWKGFFNNVDFGWGKPYWIGAMGKVGPGFRNLVVLVETQWGRGIEAFICLNDKEMAALEKDPKFLSYASPNQTHSSL